jgi:hypothetical protein
LLECVNKGSLRLLGTPLREPKEAYAALAERKQPCCTPWGAP